MNYYIYKNNIEPLDRDVSLTNEVSTDYNDIFIKPNIFIQLNQEQIDWYLLNRSVTPREVYLMRFDIVIEPTLDELKVAKRKQIEDEYTRMSSSNLDVPLPPVIWDGFKLGYPKCSATVSWLLQSATERTDKIQTCIDAINREELDLIDVTPNSPIKPYEADELLYEYFTSV